MNLSLSAPGVTGWTLFALAALVIIAILAALLTRWLVVRGMKTPRGVRLINRVTDRVVGVVKRPITVAVLDEVAAVIQTGSYTQNISAALDENRRELTDLVAEKVRNDPSSRIVNKLPGFDTIVDEVTTTTLRVIIEMLGDPRMDELISDLLRNNLTQIKQAVRDRAHEQVPEHAPPDPVP